MSKLLLRLLNFYFAGFYKTKGYLKSWNYYNFIEVKYQNKSWSNLSQNICYKTKIFNISLISLDKWTGSKHLAYFPIQISKFYKKDKYIFFVLEEKWVLKTSMLLKSLGYLLKDNGRNLNDLIKRLYNYAEECLS